MRIKCSPPCPISTFVATGDTEDEAISNVRNAIDEYFVELRKLGAPAPVPSTKAVTVEAA